MEKKTYPSGVITPELGSTNWYSDYDTNSSLLDSNITKTNSLDSKVKELETSYTNVETSLTSLSAVAKSGDYNDLSNKPESIALAEKAVADGDNNVITKTYATKVEVVTSLEPYIKKTELADVATSGSYTDLSDKPTTIAHADRSTADKNGDVITETYAKKTEIPNLDGYALSKDISKVGKTNNYKDLDNLPTIPSLDGYVTNVELSPVAKSGNYNDLSNTPEPVDLTPYATKTELNTKANDADVVHKSGTETIVGTKTFSKVTCNGNSYLKMTDLKSNTTTPTSAQYSNICVVANDDSLVGKIQFCTRADGSFDTTIFSNIGGSNDGPLRITSNNEVFPLNNKTKLGISTAKWSEVWANTFNGNLVGKQINNSDSSSLLRIFGGTSASTGANLDLNGENESSLGGGFCIRARNSSGFKVLTGKVDGSLTWNGANILTDANQIMLAKNLSGTNVAPGGVVDCGNGNGKLKQWYLNADGTFALANTLPTGIWKSTSFVSLAPNEGGMFIKIG